MRHQKICGEHHSVTHQPGPQVAQARAAAGREGALDQMRAVVPLPCPLAGAVGDAIVLEAEVTARVPALEAVLSYG